MDIDLLKDTIESCNINFLLGSGLSCPYLALLANIEALLSDLEAADIDPTAKKIIRVSVYKRYFDTVIKKNLAVLSGDEDATKVLDEYKQFLSCLNSILVKRKLAILSKEVNLFTTNVDIFLDKALEELSLEYNDGFNGRFKPTFSLSNLKTSRSKRSLHYDKAAELPVFNLMKLHGSLSWQIELPDSVIFSPTLENVRQVAGKALPDDHVVEVPPDATFAKLLAGLSGQKVDASTDAFMDAYEKFLVVVNPTKEKFRHTLMNQTYYELLRQYSNELEKENAVLFAMGFSFADEHIREITMRAANSNPTLMVHVVAYTSESGEQIRTTLGTSRNNNVRVTGPELTDDGHGKLVDKFKYDFSNINKKFAALLRSLDTEN